jgi:hypothetical protein
MTYQPEMIERVARAIFETRGYVYGDSARMFDPMKWDEFETGEYQPTKQACREDARAAIAAMREPTEGMLGAMFQIWEPGERMGDYDRRVAKETHQAAIDAALEGK